MISRYDKWPLFGGGSEGEVFSVFMWLCKDVSEMPCFTRTTNAAMCWTKIHSVCLYPGLAMKFAIASHRGR